MTGNGLAFIGNGIAMAGILIAWSIFKLAKSVRYKVFGDGKTGFLVDGFTGRVWRIDESGRTLIAGELTRVKEIKEEISHK